jgi:putative membrane protein
MKNLTCLSAIVILLSITSCGDKKAKNFNEETKVDSQGAKFISAANEAGVTEIKAAMIAQNNSKNLRVISFAKMLIVDHTKAGQDLKLIALSKNVTVVDTMTQVHKTTLGSLMQQTGSAFDKAYMQMMLADHEKAIQLFHDGAENTDKNLQDFATKTTPVLKMHLDSAKAINASLK